MKNPRSWFGIIVAIASFVLAFAFFGSLDSAFKQLSEDGTSLIYTVHDQMYISFCRDTMVLLLISGFACIAAFIARIRYIYLGACALHILSFFISVTVSTSGYIVMFLPILSLVAFIWDNSMYYKYLYAEQVRKNMWQNQPQNNDASQTKE